MIGVARPSGGPHRLGPAVWPASAHRW